ncbi:hypothetical protein BH20ACT1_BH20ACT1_08150 [soil metagenome]
MVPLAKLADSFGARVLAARLGAEGIVTQLRGGGIDGPYPMGDVEVLVSATDLVSARELLLADEVEAGFDDTDTYDIDDSDDDRTEARRTPLAPWVVLAVVVSLVLFAYVNTIGYRTPSPERDADAPGAEAQ